MKELLLDKRDAALALLKEVAKLERSWINGVYGQQSCVLRVPRDLMIRIDLVLDFPDEPRDER